MGKKTRPSKVPTKRLPRPPCPSCKAKMTHFVEGRTDTWICTTPKCPNFDIQRLAKCPACKTMRVKTENGVYVCLNPACPTYEGDVIGNEEVAELEEVVRAQRDAQQTALEGIASRPRAKPGQGTATAAKRRKEARSKARRTEEDAGLSDEEFDEAAGDLLEKKLGHKASVKVEGLGRTLRRVKKISEDQSLIALPDVKREIIDVDYEVYRHVATQLVFRRRIPEGGEPDKLTGENLDEDHLLKEEDKLNLIAKRLKGSAWSPRTAEGVAAEILKAVNGDAPTGVELDEETVRFVTWTCSFWTLKVKEESWQGEKGTKQKIQKKFAKHDKEKAEEARGEIRVFVQDRMKKAKKVLVDGPLFEGAYVALYRKVLREVNPDDDDDPGASAPALEWQRAALPDSAQA